MLMEHVYFNNFRNSHRKDIKISQGSVTVLENMANYQETRVKLTNIQLDKLKSAAKNNTGALFGINKKFNMKNYCINYSNNKTLKRC